MCKFFTSRNSTFPISSSEPEQPQQIRHKWDGLSGIGVLQRRQLTKCHQERTHRAHASAQNS